MKKLSNTKKSKLSMMKAPKPKVLELLYMATEEVTTAQLQEAAEGIKGLEIHVWPELDIMEITMASEATVDLETMNGFMDNEEDLAFMAEHQVKSVYAITIEEPAFKEFKEIAKHFIAQFGGFICSDSDDFLPMYEV